MTEAGAGMMPPSTCSAETSPERTRFEVELEFVQCLASPSYLNFLAQNEYFDSEDFVSYLKYLLYWKKPEYAKFIVFPHALYFLHLLQEARFREALKKNDYYLMLHRQQGYHWQFGKTMRVRSETMNMSNGGEKADGDGDAAPVGGDSPGTAGTDGNRGTGNTTEPAQPGVSV